MDEMIETETLAGMNRRYHQAYLDRHMGYDDWQVGNEALDGLTEREKELAYAEYLEERR